MLSRDKIWNVNDRKSFANFQRERLRLLALPEDLLSPHIAWAFQADKWRLLLVLAWAPALAHASDRRRYKATDADSWDVEAWWSHSTPGSVDLCFLSLGMWRSSSVKWSLDVLFRDSALPSISKGVLPHFILCSALFWETFLGIARVVSFTCSKEVFQRAWMLSLGLDVQSGNTDGLTITGEA